MANSEKIGIQKFNGQSFELWKLNMEVLLLDKYHWSMVDPGTKLMKMLAKDSEKLDRKVKSIIYLCILNLVLFKNV